MYIMQSKNVEWGSRGRRFESSHPDQKKPRKHGVFEAFAFVRKEIIASKSKSPRAANRPWRPTRSSGRNLNGLVNALLRGEMGLSEDEWKAAGG